MGASQQQTGVQITGGGGHSDWCLPSKDVLEVIYRNFKPITEDNYTVGSNGTNPNSEPFGNPYTKSNPQQTPLNNFRLGGTEAMDKNCYWSSTESSSWYWVS